MKVKKIEQELTEQVLSKYFSIDGKVATLQLVYDTFEELVNPNFGDERTEKLNDKLFSDIKEAIEILPKKYKLNVEIVMQHMMDTQGGLEFLVDGVIVGAHDYIEKETFDFSF